MSDRDFLFERFVDGLELYFDCRDELKKKIRRTDTSTLTGEMTLEGLYWQEYEMLENLRVLARRALDEYVQTGLTTLDVKD